MLLAYGSRKVAARAQGQLGGSWQGYQSALPMKCLSAFARTECSNLVDALPRVIAFPGNEVRQTSGNTLARVSFGLP